ncbi:MAG: alpha-D-ribose 1-methylphosphonate 5-triphosphate diphosphatase [Tagaea sp.]
MRSYRLVNCRILTPSGVVSGAELAVEDGAIRGLSEGSAPAVDLDGALVAPGIVDLHGDAFERQIMPRPGVFFDVGLALADTDRQLLANGITTAYHALTWSWEPGLRGDTHARALADALDEGRARLGCDTKLHLRWEVFNLDAQAEARGWIENGRVDLLAFNDHTPGMVKGSRGPAHAAKIAERTGLSAADFEALLQRVWARREEVSETNRTLAEAARRRGLPMASHDDRHPEDRLSWRELGCALCEFPMTVETAQEARKGGDYVLMGAPNALRGGSHLGLMSAESAVRAGDCRVLTSDYYYPALLQAPFALAARGAAPLEAAWALVSAGPAQAAGLADRGRIEPGARADLAVLDDRNGPHIRVRATYVAGARVYAA